MNKYQMSSFLDIKGVEAYNQYMNYWNAQRSLPSATIEVIAESLRNQVEFQEFSRYEKSVKVFLDQSNFRISFVTENIKDMTGYKREDWMRYNIPLAYRCILFEHLQFPLKATQFIFSIHRKIPKASFVKNFRLLLLGIKIQKKDGTLCRILLDYRPLEFDGKGIIQTALITVEDVTYIMKDDFYWARATCGENNEHKFYFTSNQKKEFDQDIISDREKDVLRLIAKGLESKEIANQLFISSGTVDNHRKNMIARTGVRDTTALVQLCLSCGII